MALAALSGDEQRILFVQLCNVLDPGLAVALSSVNNELRELTQALLQQLRTDHEAAAALCGKVGRGETFVLPPDLFRLAQLLTAPQPQFEAQRCCRLVISLQLL